VSTVAQALAANAAVLITLLFLAVFMAVTLLLTTRNQ
jgi:hypothetical protein